MFLRIMLPVLLLLSACSSTPQPPPALPPASKINAQMNNLAIYAMSLYDTPYQYGSKSRANGFDCSSFVQFVYENAVGIQLPRTSSEMSRMGMVLESNQLKPGDLVFFNTTHIANSHVGIYIGENRFLHAPSTGKAITLTRLNDKYWRDRYNGARRIKDN